jgi:predicted ATPase/DNA-binding winged helix-turn-helix (wHTH) protein
LRKTGVHFSGKWLKVNGLAGTLALGAPLRADDRENAQMAPTGAPVNDVLSFGPFRLAAGERLLTREGAPVELGARALDILVALVSTPNEVIGKKDLLSRVWPDVTVEESTLRFHMAGLRKALGDGQDGARYITTLAGRGYCFVAPIWRGGSGPEAVPAAAVAAPFPYANLPSRLSRIVGRDDDVAKLLADLSASRLITIVGAGGVGKTTLAIAVAHQLMDAFANSILFVDFGMLSDPKLASSAVASMLGQSVQAEDATPGLIAFLRDRRVLLILDTCEHLVEAVAPLAARIVEAAPQVHILATSREALRVEGEHVYRLDALACPPEAPGFGAAAVREFSATQLFVERAIASGAHLDLSDAEAPIVADICRKLDGVPLAIELAARRVESHGLQQTATLLDERLTRLWQGSRTAPPRQKTLQATLDWSYGLLSDVERSVLRRLAIFVGHFTLDAALDVGTSATLDRSLVLGAIDGLVAKSIVASRPIGAMMRYRLLDTTRAYALDIGIDDCDAAELAARHATYYRRWLEQTGAEWPTYSNGTQRAPYFAGLNNVRAALEWCFGRNGNIAIGVRLAAAAAPVFLAMSLLTEGHRWSEHAILALDDATRGGVEEMRLQAVLGVALMFTRGNADAAQAALDRSLAIAEARGDAPDQLQLLNLLHMFHHRTGDFKATLHYARRSVPVAEALATPAALGLAHCLVGSSLHHVGDISGARAELEAALQTGPGLRSTGTISVDYEHYNYAGVALARTLWLQGHPDQAMTLANRSVEEASSMAHPVSMSRALVWAVSVFLWAGDLDNADANTDLLISHAESHAMGPYLALGRGYKAVLAIRRGDATTGVESLQRCLETLHAVRYELLTATFNMALVQGFAALGRFTEALALIEETVSLLESTGNLSYMPELLRVKGCVLLAVPQPRVDDAEICFTQSLDLSRHQGARAWELRAANDMAALRARQGRPDDARRLLQPVFEQFVEGLETADLRTAKSLLADLAGQP